MVSSDETFRDYLALNLSRVLNNQRKAVYPHNCVTDRERCSYAERKYKHLKASESHSKALYRALKLRRTTPYALSKKLTLKYTTEERRIFLFKPKNMWSNSKACWGRRQKLLPALLAKNQTRNRTRKRVSKYPFLVYERKH